MLSLILRLGHLTLLSSIKYIQYHQNIYAYIFYDTPHLTCVTEFTHIARLQEVSLFRWIIKKQVPIGPHLVIAQTL
jgi:hypothetical protein